MKRWTYLFSIAAFLFAGAYSFFSASDADAKDALPTGPSATTETTTETETPVVNRFQVAYTDTTHGKVSWYGPGFHGRITANGEVYDQEGLTCASRTLPFGTLLRVTNLKNGKSVVVRVNDRGPVSPVLTLDMSKGAARKLDMIYDGIANVRIENIELIDVAENQTAAL
jgi:rare lipoprotein A